MAQYPPPPQPDQQHYNALYPASPSTQQLLDSQETLQYSTLNPSLYSKVESATSNQDPANHQIHNLTQDLHQHAALQEHERQRMQQAAQEVPQYSALGQPPSNLHAPHQPPEQRTPEQNSKVNRLRKACDSCSIRKVKCDESGPPCRACASLDIPCTFDRPSRRRGPPNKHAEAVKRRRLDDTDLSGNSSPSSPTHAAQALAALSSQTSNQQLSAQSICPIEILDLLIDDFFTYVHPLCPFPHEPSFREAWKHREDLTNTSFLALLASMLGALVSAFPRRPQWHLKAQGQGPLFPNFMNLASRCHKVCSLARGPGYLENENLNVYDAATSYHLALSAVYTFRWRHARLYFGECLTIVRTLGLHKAREETHVHLDTSAGLIDAQTIIDREQTVDNITLEMGRRIFWTIFVTSKTIHQLGAASGELVIPPPTLSEPYPSLPSEVDDFCMYATHNEPQPAAYTSMLTGFNANVDLHKSYDSLAALEMVWSIDAVVDWDRQMRVLLESLQRCRASMRQLPPELSAYPDSERNDPLHQIRDVNQRRAAQLEIQKANIYASFLSTRLYIVEKYWSLCEARDRLTNSLDASITSSGPDGVSTQDTVGQEMREERESIVKDLLAIPATINEATMESYSVYYAMKLRSIASTLLDVNDQRKGQFGQGVEEHLSAFLEILTRLERVSPINSNPDQPENEEAELRAWADLRDN